MNFEVQVSLKARQIIGFNYRVRQTLQQLLHLTMKCLNQMLKPYKCEAISLINKVAIIIIYGYLKWINTSTT